MCRIWRKAKPNYTRYTKPLLKIKDLTLLDHCLKLIIDLNIKKVLINTFYLKEQFYDFFKNHNYKIDIEIIDDRKYHT